MLQGYVYFDHNASTALLPGVREAMADIPHIPLNPSSIHSYGREAKRILENARAKVACFANADDSYNVVFTSTGTEANNLAINGLPGYQIITSTTEHQSVLSLAEFADIAVDAQGVIKLDVLEAILAQSQSSKFIVSIQYVNNETGVIQPIKAASNLVHKYGGIIHTDASQAFGKIPIDLLDLGVDMITLSGHKFGAPLGASALIAKKSIEIKPIIRGGGQEYRIRSGTQNIAAIHGLGVASEIAQKRLPEFAELSEIRDLIQTEITSFSEESVVFGKNAERVANTLSVTMPGVQSETQVIYFDMNGFAISAGSACSSGKVGLPYVQMSMGYDEQIARTSLRISLGLGNTKAQAQDFIKHWKDLFTNSNQK